MKLEFSEKRKFDSLLILSFIAIFYFSFAVIINGNNLFKTTRVAYYNDLINSFLNKRLYLSPGYDLSFFNNHWYMYWGPAPVLAISFFYFFKQNPSDVFYTLFFGITNIVIFYFIAKEFQKYFLNNSNDVFTIILVLNFAFSSPNFYLSFPGQIWNTSQIISIFYLLFFYLFYLKFLSQQKNRFFLLAALFYNFAWLSRISLIFQGVLFIYPFLKNIIENKNEHFKKILKTYLPAGIITLIFILFFFWYNQKRFGDIFETGLRYQEGTVRYNQSLKSNKLISFEYFKHNFSIYFLNNLTLSLKKPFVRIDPEGNSIISVYPIILLLPLLLQVKHLKKRKYSTFLLLSLSVVVLNFLPLLFSFGTGWVQFGCRYFFDIIPISLLLILFILPEIPPIFPFLLTFYGITVNVLGTLTFYGIIK